MAFANTDQARDEIERGAMMSLDARERFWTFCQHEVVRWRQPNSQKQLTRNARIKANGALRMIGEHTKSRYGRMALGMLRRRFVPVRLDDVLPRPDYS